MRCGNDDGIDPYWVDETDWLVAVISLFGNWPEDNDEDLDYIGRLFAFASATDTRLLAQVGDPSGPTYELWFSFQSEGQKQRFLQMIRDDGYADPDNESCLSPPVSLEDLPRLRPIAQVFPQNQCDRIVAAATEEWVSMDLETKGLLN